MPDRSERSCAWQAPVSSCPPTGRPMTQVYRKKAGIAPGLRFFVAFASVRSALRRRGRPRLDQRVVVDGFTLRLLVGQLALGRDVAILGGLREPVLSRLLLVH